MPIQQHNGLSYFEFPSLKTKHAIFTRHGGVSPEPWASLNVGGTVGDDLPRVRQNRERSFEALGCDSGSIFDVWQVHSADVVCARAPRPPEESVPPGGYHPDRPAGSQPLYAFCRLCPDPDA